MGGNHHFYSFQSQNMVRLPCISGGNPTWSYIINFFNKFSDVIWQWFIKGFYIYIHKGDWYIVFILSFVVWVGKGFRFPYALEHFILYKNNLFFERHFFPFIFKKCGYICSLKILKRSTQRRVDLACFYGNILIIFSISSRVTGFLKFSSWEILGNLYFLESCLVSIFKFNSLKLY